MHKFEKLSPLSWFEMAGFREIFTHADAIKITGFTASTLQNWTNPKRGLFKPKVQGDGKGTRRKYSSYELFVLALANRLTAIGLDARSSLTHSGMVVFALSDLIEKQGSLNKKLLIAVISRDGGKQKAASIVEGFGTKLSDALDSRLPRIVLPLSEVLDQIGRASLKRALELHGEGLENAIAEMDAD